MLFDMKKLMMVLLNALLCMGVASAWVDEPQMHLADQVRILPGLPAGMWWLHAAYRMAAWIFLLIHIKRTGIWWSPRRGRAEAWRFIQALKSPPICKEPALNLITSADQIKSLRRAIRKWRSFSRNGEMEEKAILHAANRAGRSVAMTRAPGCLSRRKSRRSGRLLWRALD